MRVSLSWLKDLVEVEVTALDLAEKLSMAGFEVESLEDQALLTKGVVVGHVKKISPHPNADKLKVCVIDVGKPEDAQIVCGASNIIENIHVPVALPGTLLAVKGITIKSSELRGVKSEGMVCSLEELGIEDVSSGIAILEDINSDIPKPGNPISEFLKYNDTIIELAITANRPDGMSMIGIANEVSALTKAKLNIPKISNGNFKKSEIPNELTKLIPENGIYALTSIRNVNNNVSSPQWLTKRLESSGIRSINAVVDITNYVMLEQGQPLHAFDADILENNICRENIEKSIGIRMAKSGEKFKGIDSREISLDQAAQVITYKNKIIALAGVIGGLESSVKSDSTNIFLEAAVFSPSLVRNTSRSAGCRTESSGRFEKGLAENMTIPSSIRATELITDICGGKVENQLQWQEIKKDVSPILLQGDSVRRVLGPMNIADEEITVKPIAQESLNQTKTIETKEIENEEIELVLTSLGCKLEAKDSGWLVIPPVLRSNDLVREIDLIEEVARLIGYDKFSSNLPDPIKPGYLTSSQHAERKLRNILASIGFQEITTLSLVGTSDSDNERIAISNPLQKETSHLRTNLWNEHLNICQRNFQSGQDGCWLYEIGNIYYKDSDSNKVQEKTLLSGILSGDRRLERWKTSGKLSPLDYFEARGKLELVFKTFKLETSDITLRTNPLLHPGRSATLILEGKPMGIFGQLHPSYLEKYSLPKSTYLFEIELKTILDSATRTSNWTTTFEPFSVFPAMERDISIILSKDKKCGEITKFIKKVGKPLLESVDLIDLYESDTLPINNCSQTYRLKYRAKDKTLKEDDIAPIHEKIIRTLQEKMGSELRAE